MSFKPDYIVLDFETNSLDFYLPSFQVVSCAVAYVKDGKTVSAYYDTAESIFKILKAISDQKIPLVVFNASFELGVLTCCYPSLPFTKLVDVMRLSQLLDGGGKTKEFGLKAVVERHLPQHANYEAPIHDWLMRNIPDIKKSKVGAHLSKAPRELLEAYNRKDVEVTLELYQMITQKFAKEKYDWKTDHDLYLSSVRIVTKAKIEGVLVNSDKLATYIEDIKAEVKEIDRKFFKANRDAINAVREMLKVKEQAKYKKKIVTETPRFNMTSKKHLEFLFMDVLGQVPRLKTKTGKPSFKASHLGQWQGAELLVNRGKRLLVKKQAEKLLDKASVTGRWHIDLRLCSTKTGRASGGGGLNVQATPRRDKGMMSCIEADEEYTFVSIDLSAGEPACTSHFSKDVRYRWATLEGIGKAPFYKDNILYIDDLYLMYLSVSPFGSIDMKNLFDTGVFEDGRNFVDQWLHNAEYIKTLIKKKRAISKTCALGLAYGLGPKNLQKSLFEQSLEFDLDTCKQAFNKYWTLFKDVKAYGKKKGLEFKKNGFVTTEFGFRVIPDAEYKAFNNYIQATVAGIIHVLGEYIVKLAPYATIITQIHDEYVVKCPSHMIEEFRLAVQEATTAVNTDLAWTVPIRTGFVTGNTFYDAK